MAKTGNRLGCNTLFPDGRLTDAKGQFDLKAQRRALNTIREAGFDACEFSHYEYLTQSSCGKLRCECERLGLLPWSAHSWVVIPETQAEAEATLPLQRKSLEAARALGAQVMVVHAACGRLNLTDPTQRHRRVAGLETSLVGLAPYAMALGIDVAIENCSSRAELEFLVETVRMLSLPHIGFNVDTGHAVLHGMAPADVIGLMGKQLLTTHLQDNHGQRDDHLPPGCGSINWADVLAALHAVKYKGTLMVEISDCPPGREPDAVADTRRAFENLHRLTHGA